MVNLVMATLLAIAPLTLKRSKNSMPENKGAQANEVKNDTYHANIPSVSRNGHTPLKFHRYTQSSLSLKPYHFLLEDFEGTFPPSGWTVQSLNTADSTWHQSSQWSHSGDNSAIVWWSFQPQNEWLITPQIELTGSPDSSYYFSFWTYAYKGSTYGDHYYVFATKDGGTTWDTLMDFSAYTAPDTGRVDTQYVFDVSSYAGDTVQFAFQAVADTGLWYIWAIDYVNVFYPYTHDIQVAQITSPSSDTIEPGIYPIRATFKNLGLVEDTFLAEAKVDSEGVTVMDTSFDIILSQGEEIDTSFGDFNFSLDRTHYMVTISATLASDEDMSNNMLKADIYTYNPHHGGPDGFGYTFMDSDYPTGPAFSWIDPTQGTELTLGDDDTVTIQLPFPFKFYENTINALILSSNGFLSTYSNGTGIANKNLPDTTRENIIAPWWDDQNPSAQGQIYYYVPADSSYALIAFINVPHYGETDGNTFEVILYPDGNILMQYEHVGSTYATGSTVGIQGGHGYNNYYLQYTYNGSPIVPHDSLAILFNYPLYNYEIALTQISEPFMYQHGNGSPEINVTLANLGINPVGGLPVTLEVWQDGNLVYTGNTTVDIDTAEVTTVTFNPTGLVNSGKYDVIAYHSLSMDERHNDDTLTTYFYLTDNMIDFENGTDLFDLQNGWEWGSPSYTDAPQPYSGNYLTGTVLNDDYENDANYIMERKFVITGSNPELLFYNWYDIESRYDGGNVKISTDGGQTFSILTPIDGYPYDTISDGNAGIPNEPGFSGHLKKWELEVFPITGCNTGDTVIIRWQFGSDGSVNYPGWYIDNVAGIDLAPYYPAHDLAVSDIQPGFIVSSNSYFIPEITIINQGTNSDDAIVVAIVDSEGINIQGQTVQMHLNSLETQNIYLDPVFTGDNGIHYTVKARILPISGEDTSNNYMEKTFVTDNLVKNIYVPVASVEPDIDGMLKQGEWDDAAKVEISDVYGQTGTEIAPQSANLYMKLDTVRGLLLMAVQQKIDSTLDDYDQIGLFFDENNNGAFPASGDNSEGNYWIVYHPAGNSFVFRPIYNDGTTGDTIPMSTAKGISLTDGTVSFEAAIPVGPSAEYLNFDPQDTVGFFMYSYDNPTGTYYGWWPQDLEINNWNKPEYYGKLYMPQWTGVNEQNQKQTKLQLLTKRTMFKGRVAVELNVPEKTEVNVNLYDIQGRTVKSEKLTLHKGQNTIRIANNLRDGIYFISIRAQNTSIRKKILITQ